MRDLLLKCLLSFFVLLLSLWAADRALGLAGFSDGSGMQITNYANFHARVKFDEYEYDFRTNRDGLRYSEVPAKKEKGEYRYLVLGDSYAQGVGVEAENIFTSLLEKSLSDSSQNRLFRFINAGLAGTGPLDYARVLRFVGWKYKPDAVLIMVYANDVSDMRLDDRALTDYNFGMGFKPLIYHAVPRLYGALKRMRSPIKAAVSAGAASNNAWEEGVIQAAQSKGIASEKIQAWKAALPAELLESANRGRMDGWVLALGLLNPNYWTDSLNVDRPDALKKWEGMELVLSRMAQEARDKKTPLGIIFAPAPFQYDAAASSIWEKTGMVMDPVWAVQESSLQNRLKEWAQERRIPFLDLTPTLKASNPESLHFRVDHHWNNNGHRVAAQEIWAWLKRENWIGAPPGAASI